MEEAVALVEGALALVEAGFLVGAMMKDYNMYVKMKQTSEVKKKENRP